MVLIQKRKEAEGLSNAKGVWESFYYEKTIFSDYCHNLIEKNTIVSNSLDLINNHYILLREQFSRKYIIDMMSIYSL